VRKALSVSLFVGWITQEVLNRFRVEVGRLIIFSWQYKKNLN